MKIARKTTKNFTRYGVLTALLLVSVESGALAQSSPSQPAILLAAKNAVNSTQDKEYASLVKYLKNLEVRYFFHSYDHDPIEKRVERLELLVFGGSRYGVFEERIKALKKAIEKRDQEAARKIQERNKKVTKPGAKADYPIMNTLEWRVLKKTYQSESLDTRLERLEKKLLGQASPAMSYADRIDRLKKIVGISITSLPPKNNKLSPGPMPRANRPRMLTPFGKSFPNLNPNGKNFEQDFFNQMNKDLPNIMRYMDDNMNKRMKDLFENMPEFKRVMPDGKTTPYITPLKKKEVVIPPYADPNSI